MTMPATEPNSERKTMTFLAITEKWRQLCFFKRDAFAHNTARRTSIPNAQARTMNDYLRGSDLSHLPADVIEMYDTAPREAIA